MAIVSEKARLVYFPTPGQDANELKKELHAIFHDGKPSRRPPGLSNWKGWRTLPYKGELDHIEPNYTSVAFLTHPVDQVVQAWAHHALSKQFHKNSEADTIEAAGLSLNPTLITYLQQFEGYRKASATIRQATEPADLFLGEDLSRYDHIFTVDELLKAQDFFYERAGISLRPAGPIIRSETNRVHITQLAVNLLREITAPQLARLKDHLTFEDSVFTQRPFLSDVRYSDDMPTHGKCTAPKAEKLYLATMLKEEPALVHRFVDHYCDLGFTRLYMYFDDPADPMIAHYADHPVVEPIACDDAFWEGHNRKNALEARQKIIFKHAYARHSDGWMMFCDADEFLWSERPLPALLAAAPPEQRTIRASSREPVWREGSDIRTPFSADLLRIPIWGSRWRDLGPMLYGDQGGIFSWNMVSHISGKYMVRCGLEVDVLSTHVVYFTDGKQSDTAIVQGGVKAELIHYDALCFDHWCSKLDRRLVPGHSYAGQSNARRAQVKRYARSTQDQRETMFRELYCLNDEQLNLLAYHQSVSQLKAF